MILIPVAVLPRTLDLPEDRSAARMFCELALAVLRDVQESCLLVTDGTMQGRFEQQLDRWPQQPRVLAKLALEQLRKHKRIIEVANVSYDCAVDECNVACMKGLLVDSVPCKLKAAFSSETCVPVLRSVGSIEIIDVAEYTSSGFRQRLRNSYTVGAGEWCSTDFENRVLGPLCATASKLTIIDKMIARSAMGDEASIDRYKLTLNWIMDCIGSFSRRRDCFLEIYTGLDAGRLSLSEMRKVQLMMGHLRLELEARCGRRVELHVHACASGLKLPHERYFATDQFALSIDRGCDLFLSINGGYDRGLRGHKHDDKMRDMNISVKPTADVAKVILEYKAVSDLDQTIHEQENSDPPHRAQAVERGFIIPQRQ